MSIRRASLRILVLLLCVAGTSPAQGVNETLGFARSLQAEGEYYRAITEYKRVLYLTEPESLEQREVAILGIGGALFSGAEYARSAEWLHAHVRDLRPGEIRLEGIRMMNRALLADGAGSRLLEISQELGDSTGETRLYEGLAHARIRQWNQAAVRFKSLSMDDRCGPIASRFAVLSQAAVSADWKSPDVAAALGLVPGGGYWYAGHRQTAFASLLVNGLFVGATIQAFRSDQTYLGGFLAAFTASWYAGNVYGSALAARRHNEQLQEQLWDQFQY
jgi:hypothetical protein